MKKAKKKSKSLESILYKPKKQKGKKNKKQKKQNKASQPKFPTSYGLGGNANFTIQSDEDGTVWHLDLNTGIAKRVTFV